MRLTFQIHFPFPYSIPATAEQTRFLGFLDCRIFLRLHLNEFFFFFLRFIMARGMGSRGY